jgi:archaellum component FlaG (FlaF/FlaG flagellin family)
MTKSGTESTMAYSLPTQDTDRIEFRVAAREANTIRHIVPLTQLILLTAAAEWRVTSVNSDALTPSSISVRPQSYVGASNVQPQIINNALVYCAARGGHVRELGYSWQSSAFVTGDVSLRAAHLFDNYSISDMAFSKAPIPLLWFVSSNGRLLGLTYIPEQQVSSWHWHDTDGSFESCATVAEGNDDVLYVVVKRTINGQTKRYIERMASRHFDDIKDCFFVDSGLTYNGNNTSPTTVTISGGTNWGPGESLTIFLSSTTYWSLTAGNVNDAIVLTAADGTEYRITITSVIAGNEALGRVDKVLPAGFRNTAVTNWALAIKDIGGLSHLQGKTVSILADGAVQPQQVVTAGVVSVPRPATIIHVGLPYDSDLQTLPVALQIDGFGQGRYKNVNKAWLRVYQSSGIFIGPDVNNLTEAKQRTREPYGTPPSLKTQEILVMTTPTWQDSGQVFVRQSDPLPLTCVALTLEVSIGG